MAKAITPTFEQIPFVNTKLRHLFDVLEQQRIRAEREIINLDTEKLHAHLPGKWSVAQVYSHLITSEQLSIAYLKKKSLGIKDFKDTGLVEELKMLVLIVSQRLPIKFKAPKVVVENTPVYQTPAQIIEAWDATRKQMKDLLDTFSDRHLSRKVYRHPVAGMLNIRQTLRFFREHIIHHTPQIKRLLKNA